MKIGIILSGCGVYDGSEIHEAVFTLLAIEENKAEAVIYAPNINQHHVVNHINGDEMKETRNVLTESARIARGNIKSLDEFDVEDIDALVLPGGFGAAKNLSEWAFKGPDCEINEQVKNAIISTHQKGKPLCGVCMGPTLIAKALEKTETKATLTVGTTKEGSPYDIAGINAGIEKTGAATVEKTIREISVDEENKIVTAPCYMMEATILEIRKNVKAAVDATIKMI